MATSAAGYAPLIVFVAGMSILPATASGQDVVFIESANALTAYLSLKPPMPVLQDRSSGAEKTEGQVIWHPALDGEKGILFASFESGVEKGAYLRRKADSLVVEQTDGTDQFASDASFKLMFSGGGSFTLESVSRPGYFIRHHGSALTLEPSDQSVAFDGDTSYFRIPYDAR